MIFSFFFFLYNLKNDLFDFSVESFATKLSKCGVFPLFSARF